MSPLLSVLHLKTGICDSFSYENLDLSINLITFAYQNNYKIKPLYGYCNSFKNVHDCIKYCKFSICWYLSYSSPNGISNKIHDAYPQLSVMWLMFGEGEMLTDANFKISEPKKGDNIEFGEDQQSVDEVVIHQLDFDSPMMGNPSEKFSIPNSPQKQSKEENNEVEKVVMTKPIEKNASVSLSANSSKKVIEIRVFYNDNSYEIFVPQKN